MASPFITGPFVPVAMLNLIRAVLGIHHHRFNLSVKRSRTPHRTRGVTMRVSARSVGPRPTPPYPPPDAGEGREGARCPLLRSMLIQTGARCLCRLVQRNGRATHSLSNQT